MRVDFETERLIKEILSSKEGQKALRILMKRELKSVDSIEPTLNTFLKIMHDMLYGNIGFKDALRWGVNAWKGDLEPIGKVLELLKSEAYVLKERRSRVAEAVTNQVDAVYDEVLGIVDDE